MSILISNEIMDGIRRELMSAEKSVQIITAYCKEDTFVLLNSFIDSSVDNRRLLVRFRLDDIVSGSTDFGVLEKGVSLGWQVYIRFDLHAKTYIVDNKRCFVGSANTTNSGLSIGKPGNMEVATLVDVESGDVSKIDKLFNDAIRIDEDILQQLKKQYEQVKTEKRHEKYSWDSTILSLFTPHVDTLFSYDLPEISSVSDSQYVAFLDMRFDGNLPKLKECFRWSNSYLWLLNVLEQNDGVMFFGELTVKLHEAVVSDPKPYRKDVKTMLANLLSIIEELSMEEIVIDRPNYSQRVRLKSVVE